MPPEPPRNLLFLLISNSRLCIKFVLIMSCTIFNTSSVQVHGGEHFCCLGVPALSYLLSVSHAHIEGLKAELFI